MSTTTAICRVIADAIRSTPALSALTPDAVYVGVPPAGVTTCVCLDGVFSIEAKQKTKGMTLNVFMPFGKLNTRGDIHDIADALMDALKGTAILPSNWAHQPDTANNIDRVVLPVTVYMDAL